MSIQKEISGKDQKGRSGKSPAPRHEHYVIAIGASAGGLESIHEFFDNMPQGGNLSFVIIQHLSPDHKSLLVELIARHTHMKVFEAENGMTIHSQCVYVIPNNKIMTVSNGKLALREKPEEKGPNTAIDIFLHALAKDRKSASIAVILSGTGTDGSRGIASVKEHGGMVIVQDPLTAKFDGMPNSAIETGHADFVLPPELMPDEIFGYIRESPVQVLSKGKVDEELLGEIFRLVYKNSGYDFHHYKTPTLIRRLSNRMSHLGYGNLPDYVGFLRTDSDEAAQLGREFLIGVTRFFRDRPAFEILEKKVLPQIVQMKDEGELLKVWITACSTGEEAYSVAILIDRYLQECDKALEVKIFATDINSNSIALAGQNSFLAAAVADLDPALRKAYFVKNGNHVSVIERIRKQIVFARHNVIKDPPFIANDLISCRNMLIYMSPALQQRVLSRLHFSLKSAGYLFLGPSETAAFIKEGLQEVDGKWKIFRKTGAVITSGPDLFRNESPVRTTAEPRMPGGAGAGAGGIMEDFRNLMFEDLGYVAFHIDTNYEIRETAGNYHKYLSLPEKNLKLNLLKMVPRDLSVALNTAVRKAWKESVKVFLKSVRVRTGAEETFVNISVKPAKTAPVSQFTLIVIGEVLQKIGSVEPVPHPHPQVHMADQHEYVADLEAELSETRTSLQMAVESLETANEELQSSNEELLSANEELQSSNEELQSLNEELHTLNTEHQIKIRELIELNDDLNNYFRSTDFGQIFLDSSLNIRKFNPAATRMINLIDSDIGRPLNHISTNFAYDGLLSDILRVRETGGVIEKEIAFSGGRAVLVRLFPYVRQDNVIDGVIMCFVDISAITHLNSIIKGVFNASLSAIIAVKAVRNHDERIIDFECLARNEASGELLKSAGSVRSLRQDAPHLFAGGFLEKFCRVVETDKPFRSEIRLDEQWYQLVAVKMQDGLVITYTNISQKKAYDLKLKKNYNELIVAKENLRKLNDQLEETVSERTHDLSVSEERFRMVSEAINDVIWDWDLVNDRIWWSDSYHTRFGYNRSDGVRRSSMRLSQIHPEDRPRVEKSIFETINSSGVSWNQEYRFMKADGTYAHVLDRGQVMRNEYNTPYRMLGSMLDVTELRQAEQRLMTSEAKFRRIFDSNMLGMLFTDSSGNVHSANDYFLHLIGYSRHELEAGEINWKQLTPPEYLEKAAWAVSRLKETGVCPTFEREYLRKDGKRVWVLEGSAALQGDSQAVAVSYIIDVTDKKEAEAKEESLRRMIRKQQDEFKGIFMDAPALVVIRRGPDLTVDFYNKAVADFFGTGDFRGLTNASLSRYYRAVGDDRVRQVFETGEPFIGKAFHVQYDRHGTGQFADGWFDFVHQPVYDDQGKIDGVATFGFDVTDMVLANRELLESQHKLRFLADSIPNKVWTALPDGSIDYINNVMLDYTGKSLEDLRENGWKDIVHPDDWERFSYSWKKAIETGESLELERRLKNARGEYRWHLTRSIPQMTTQGFIYMWVSSSTDIHDQKSLVEEIRASEIYFRQLADKSPFMIWKVGVDGLCNYVNIPWLDFTGLTFEESLGYGWIEAFHPEDRGRLTEDYKLATENRESYSFKLRIRNREGEYRWVLGQSNPLIGDSFQGYIGSLTDITEQEMAQQSLKIMMQKKDEFMSIASHELKTPITSVKASLQLVQRMAEKQKQAGDIHLFIDRANRQVKKLSDLVEDLLDVTKIQAGKLMFNESEFSIGDAVEDCVMQVQNSNQTHEIRVEGDRGIRVFADRHRIEQVIINFLSNAVKYSPGADKVVLTLRSDSGNLWVEVQDFGIGIPEDKVNYVFDRFFRVQESSQKFSGLGLGLFISAEIIRRHNGDIGVRSREGAGSVFWFRLNRIGDPGRG